MRFRGRVAAVAVLCAIGAAACTPLPGTGTPGTGTTVGGGSTGTTAPKPTPTPKPKPSTPGPLPRISGLTTSEVANAWAVVQEGHRMGISIRGQIIAMATALQESHLINYKYAVDHDSLGIFQQRPSTGWGTPRQIENPTYAAHAFYAVLLQYKSAWGCLTCAAQDVQRSAFPNAYAKWEGFATTIVTILNRRF